ncbi:hypothetical protein, partial [Actinomadura sp. DC4]|uniref:hypothetical protein n=1 Tax=Actinomadura sp. DC4 TaxID=3055069 RepID=UPI0025B186A4
MLRVSRRTPADVDGRDHHVGRSPRGAGRPSRAVAYGGAVAARLLAAAVDPLATVTGLFAAAARLRRGVALVRADPGLGAFRLVGAGGRRVRRLLGARLRRCGTAAALGRRCRRARG